MNNVNSQKAPIIGIVIPTYEASDYLRITLESIRLQTIQNWECVIVDDGSQDNSHAIAQEFADCDSRFRAVRQLNGGASMARNTGADLLSESDEFVTFMDADDVYLPHALETLLQELKAHPDAIAVHGLAEYIDAEGKLFDLGARPREMRDLYHIKNGRLRKVAPDEITTFAKIIRGSPLFPPGVFLTRRADFDRTGGFDTSITGGEDWDLLVRLSRYGHFIPVNQVLLHYRRHGRNHGAVSSVPKQVQRVHKIIYHSPENNPLQKQQVRAVWKAAQREFETLYRRELRKAARAKNFKDVALNIARLLLSRLRYIFGPRRPNPKPTR